MCFARLRFLLKSILSAVLGAAAVAHAEDHATVPEGARVTLTAVFSGDLGPAAYFQWSKDGVTLADAREATLILPAVSPEDAGAYTVYVTTAGGTASSPYARLRVAAKNPSRIANFSIISAEAGTLLVGFALAEGAPAATSSFLIRAAGPALAQFGVEEVRADPLLRVFRQDQLVTENDNWDGADAVVAASAAASAFEFSAGSRDSAAVVDLSRAGYTAQVSSATGHSGTTLFELFEVNADSGPERPRLVNLSALVTLRPDGDSLTAGFAIRGGAPVRVLARAIGPTLASFGVTDALANPRLTLYRGSERIGANVDWLDAGGALVADAARDAGAFALPWGSRDSTILTRLPPGTYTLRLDSTSAAGGVALIEVYEVP